MASTLRLGMRGEQLYVFIDDQTFLPVAPSVTSGAVNVLSVAQDPATGQNVQNNITAQGLAQSYATQNDILVQLLVELKTITYYLSAGLNVPDDPDTIRQDQATNPQLN